MRTLSMEETAIFIWNTANKLSKSEKKILKKELKAYKKNPEDYAMMKEKTKTKIQ